jgi:ferredoxin
VMNGSFGWMDRRTLHRYGQAIDRKMCRFCGACTGQCPHGVSVADLTRCLIYNDGYGDPKLAAATYAELNHRQTPEAASPALNAWSAVPMDCRLQKICAAR